MSSDMMIICKEDDSSFEGKNSNKAFFVDECSMGEPWSDFGKWFQERFCKGPSIIEQMAGITDHSFQVFTKEDLASVKIAVEEREKHKDLDSKRLINYLKEHLGKHLSTENW